MPDSALETPSSNNDTRFGAGVSPHPLPTGAGRTRAPGIRRTRRRTSYTTLSTDSWPNRRLYSPVTSSIRRISPPPGGARMTSSLERSLPISPSESRHWPRASSTVRPSGNRGVTVSPRKASHAASSTTSPDWLPRPMKSSYFTHGSVPSGQVRETGASVSAHAAAAMRDSATQTSTAIRIESASHDVLRARPESCKSLPNGPARCPGQAGFPPPFSVA